MSAVIENEPVNHLAARRKTVAERKRDLTMQLRAESIAATQTSKHTKKRALVMLLEDTFPGYQPVIEMCHKAHRISQIADARPNDSMAQMDAVNAHEKVAKYVSPQLKAIDLTSGGEQIQFGFQMNMAVLPKVVSDPDT